MKVQAAGTGSRSSRKVLWLLSFLVLAALSYRLLQSRFVTGFSETTSAFPTPAASTVAMGMIEGQASTAAADPPGLSFFKTLHEQGAGFDLVIHYPYLQDPNDPSVALFDRAIENFVRGIADTFKNDTHPDALLATSLSADYQVLYDQDGLVSLYYEINTIASGAAHPGSSSQVFNFDRKLGRELRLADLFRPGAGYLQVLSAYCTGILNEEGRLMFEKGAQPFQENFRKWNLTPAGLLLTFDPYQVAPYSAGFIQITVPYSVVAPILDRQGVLSGKASP